MKYAKKKNYVEKGPNGNLQDCHFKKAFKFEMFVIFLCDLPQKLKEIYPLTLKICTYVWKLYVYIYFLNTQLTIKPDLNTLNISTLLTRSNKMHITYWIIPK